MAALTQPLVEIGFAASPKPGETESGDSHVLLLSPERALVAVMDGLGHGPETAAAAKKAADSISAHWGEGLVTIASLCQAALKGTRGVVMSLGAFNAQNETLTWLGIGNVEAVLLRQDPLVIPRREVLLLRAGLLGGRLPNLREATTPLHRGDTLVLATDGIRGTFFFDLSPVGGVQQLAQGIMNKYRLGTDDALVVVVRYLGLR